MLIDTRLARQTQPSTSEWFSLWSTAVLDEFSDLGAADPTVTQASRARDTLDPLALENWEEGDVQMSLYFDMGRVHNVSSVIPCVFPCLLPENITVIVAFCCPLFFLSVLWGLQQT